MIVPSSRPICQEQLLVVPGAMICYSSVINSLLEQPIIFLILFLSFQISESISSQPKVGKQSRNPSRIPMVDTDRYQNSSILGNSPNESVVNI